MLLSEYYSDDGFRTSTVEKLDNGYRVYFIEKDKPSFKLYLLQEQAQNAAEDFVLRTSD